MLVISRGAGESFFIGEDIKVIILESTASQTRIGIEAPKTRKILRDELLDPSHPKYRERPFDE